MFFRLNIFINGGISGIGEKVFWGVVNIIELGLKSQWCLLGILQTTKFRLTGKFSLIRRNYFVIR